MHRRIFPLLERYGFGAFFFVTEFPQPPFPDTTLYMTWAQMGDLAGRGFEVANHTWKHSHVDRESREQLVAEVRYIEDKLASVGAPHPISFAYPAYVTTPDAAHTLRALGYVFAHRWQSRLRSAARRSDARPQLDDWREESRRDFFAP